MSDYAEAVVQKYAEDATNPRWDYGGKMHNWRTYVPEEVQAIWFTLDLLSRCIMVSMAEDRADQEDWDV